MKIIAIFIAVDLVQYFLQAQFVTEKSITPGEEEIKDQVMHLEVLDAVSGQKIPVDIRVTGLTRKTLIIPQVSDTLLPIRTYRLLNISCLRKGYMYYSHKFWPEEKHVHEERIVLKPLKVGLKTGIQEISFLGDQTEIYSKSNEALDELVLFMNMHPNMKLAVIGHVNGPDKEKSSSFYRKASLKRAESVREYLISKGIDATRLEARGAGNTEMIFPSPETDWQSEANRRIEIEITGL